MEHGCTEQHIVCDKRDSRENKMARPARSKRRPAGSKRKVYNASARSMQQASGSAVRLSILTFTTVQFLDSSNIPERKRIQKFELVTSD